jgi:hypothetical protein
MAGMEKPSLLKKLFSPLVIYRFPWWGKGEEGI